jgi:dynein heavy chain
MCIKLQIAENKVDPKDYAFFLRGGVSMDGGERKEEDKKPNHDWIKQTAWDQLLEVQKQLPSTFAGICYAVNVNAKEWKHWFQSTTPEPEDAQLPGEWVTKCEDPIKKMIILRCFRPDRVNFAIRNFIKQRMNSEEFI